MRSVGFTSSPAPRFAANHLAGADGTKVAYTSDTGVLRLADITAAASDTQVDERQSKVEFFLFHLVRACVEEVAYRDGKRTSRELNLQDDAVRRQEIFAREVMKYSKTFDALLSDPKALIRKPIGEKGTSIADLMRKLDLDTNHDDLILRGVLGRVFLALAFTNIPLPAMDSGDENPDVKRAGTSIPPKNLKPMVQELVQALADVIELDISDSAIGKGIPKEKSLWEQWLDRFLSLPGVRRLGLAIQDLPPTPIALNPSGGRHALTGRNGATDGQHSLEMEAIPDGVGVVDHRPDREVLTSGKA